MTILKLCGVFLSSSADTQPVLSLLSLLVPRNGADIAHVIWHGVTHLTERAQNLHGNHISSLVRVSEVQITWKPLLKRTITPSLITESTTASSDRGENCSVESNELLCLAPPESFPRAKAKFY